MVRVIGIIKEGAKLPYNTVRGSIKERNAKAKSYIEKFTEYIDKTNKSDTCNTTEFKKAVDYAIYPNKIDLKSKSVESNYIAAIGRQVTGKFVDVDTFLFNINGYELNISSKHAVSKRKLTKDCAVHEAYHLFDNLTQPKLIVIRMNELNTNKLGDLRSKVRKIFFSKIKKKELKKEVREVISQMTSETAIDVLQECRHHLLSERNAYKTQRKYLEKDWGNNARKINAINNFVENKLQIDRKLKILKDLIKEEIKKVRNQKTPQN